MKTRLVWVLILLLAGSTVFPFSSDNIKTFPEDPASSEKTTEGKKEFSEAVGCMPVTNEVKNKLRSPSISVYLFSPTTHYYLPVPSGNTTEVFLSFNISKIIYPFHSFL